MIGRIVKLALAAAILAGATGDDALAGDKKKKRKFVYESAPEYVLRRPLSFIFGGGYALTPEEFAMIYGEDPDFDERYYDPQQDVQEAPSKQKSKVVKPIEKPAAKTAAVTVKTAATEPASKIEAPAEKTAGGALTCDKAGQIITGYGFTSVKPSACTGKIYAFDASRDGKSFAVKLDSTSGELTEVKKQ